MLKKRLLFMLILFSGLLRGQSLAKKFFQLSRPERHWVLAHPFVARKALHITERTLHYVDSLRRNNILTDDNGGKLDAFRHACWMALLTRQTGMKRALKLGNAHEHGNVIAFRKKTLEENQLPDSVSCLMDLMNNFLGAGIAVKNGEEISEPRLVAEIMQQIQAGCFVTISKDGDGNYLDAQGKKLEMQNWKGKWNIPKQLHVSVNCTIRPEQFESKLRRWKK